MGNETKKNGQQYINGISEDRINIVSEFRNKRRASADILFAWDDYRVRGTSYENIALQNSSSIIERRESIIQRIARERLRGEE